MKLRSHALRILSFTALLTFVWLLAGCSVTTKLKTPLPIKSFGVTNDDAIGLYVPDASKKYVWNGSINVVPYHVEFGNALEPNAKYALLKVFREVVIIDRFPPGAVGIAHAVSVEIEDAHVAPGALTFSSTAAQLRLKAVVANGGQVDGNSISVQGRAEGSPGVMGAIPILGMNQMAYNAALQKAAEQAMTDALEQLVDAISKHDWHAP